MASLRGACWPFADLPAYNGNVLAAAVIRLGDSTELEYVLAVAAKTMDVLPSQVTVQFDCGVSTCIAKSAQHSFSAS